jgi:tetratricopeptide (TPR) repeat protein
VGQRPDNQIAPRSVEFQKQAHAQIAAGNLSEAAGLLETALAVDPRNRSAFLDLARVAKHQKLFGTAIRFANEALQLEPRDVDAIAIQGEAMVELGAIPRARENLARLQKLCSAPCPQAIQLSNAITRGATVAAATTPEVPKTD